MLNGMKRFKLFHVFLGVLIMLSGLVPIGGPATVHAAGTVYYVDSADGDDANDGMASGSAWKTLEKVNDTVFEPGDSILFKTDGVWTGTLSPQGSGSEGNPITIDKYGDGGNPLIAGGGAAAAVYFYNQEQWEVRNLEITNDAATAGVRRGIHVDGSSGTWTDPKVYKHFLFENLDIHNVKGDVGNDYVHNGGIIVWGTNWDYHVSDVVVKNSKIHTVDSVGIYLYGAQKQYSSGFRVAGNEIYDVAADGAVLLDTTGGVIENNVVYNTHVRASGYHVPLWVFSAKDAVIQNNEVYNTGAGGDAMAYDADYKSDGTIIQYNYSHNNAGGGFLVVNDGTVSTNANTNTQIRYNISQNDSGAVFNLNGTPDTTTIYNNTVYLSAYSNTKVVETTNWGGFAKNSYYYNNLIYNLGTGGYNFAGSTNNVFEHNLFYGSHPASEPADAYKVTADPLLASPGSASAGTDSLAGYQLLSTSPAIGAGKLMTGNGGRDYFGNPVSDTDAPNIGAYGGAGLDPDNLPSLPQPPEDVNLLKNSGLETGDFTNWPLHYNSISIVNDNANSGDYAVKLSGAYAGMQQDVINLHPNTLYKLYAYGKSAGGGDAVFGVKDFGGGSLDSHISSTVYTRKDITFTTGESNTTATVFLYKAGAAGDNYFDDLVLVQYGPAPEGSGDDDPVFAEGTSDEFNADILDDQWQWIRENSANWSLTADPGSLRIVSEAGDIVDGGATAKNILLTGAPEGDWTIETKLDGKPSSQWSQGGLIVYADDYNWFRLTRLYGEGNQLQFTKQVDAIREHEEIADPIESTTAYLRIGKIGNAYQAYYSADGANYTEIWTAQTADFDNIKIGLTAAAGTGLTADFDYFHIETPIPPDVPVTGITLDRAELQLNPGETAALTPTIQPAGATNREVAWTSSDPAVATVDASGNVAAIGEGTATVTAITVDGSFTASASVQVVPIVNLLTDPSFESGVCTGMYGCFGGGGIVQSNARTGEYAARVAAQYGGVARYVNGLTPSTTYTFTAWGKALDGGSARLEVQKPNGAPIRTTQVNSETYTKRELTFTTGADATSVKIELYKPVADGEVFLDDMELTAADSPVPVAVTAVTLDRSELSLHVGDTDSLTAAIAPANATDKSVTWSSSSPEVATVTADGTVTAVGAGSATITVTTTNGAKTAAASVEVLNEEPPASASATLSANAATFNAGQPFELTVGAAGLASGLESGFVTLDVVVDYDPEQLGFEWAGDPGKETLAASAFESLHPGLSLLGSAVKPEEGKIRLILSGSDAQHAVHDDGPLFKLIGKVNAGAAIGATEFKLSRAETSVGGEGASLDISAASVAIGIAADKSALQQAISDAQTQHDEAMEGSGPGQYPAGSKATLQAAIDAASAVKGNAAATQEQVNQAVGTLHAAADAFADSVIPGVPADRTELNAAIAAAQAKLDKAAEGDKVGKYAVGSKAALQAAIVSANNADTGQEAVDQAVIALNAAVQHFLTQIVTLVPGAMQVSIRDLSIIAQYYGTTSEDGGWSEIEKADVLGANIIDIRTLAAVAQMILDDWRTE